MIETALGTSIAFTAPHRLATKAGFDILEAGGPAVEAVSNTHLTLTTILLV